MFNANDHAITTDTLTQYIEKEKAKSIAFNHAGISSSLFDKIDIKMDDEDGITVYEVEFCVAGIEYDYKINAITGEVVSYENEYEND